MDPIHRKLLSAQASNPKPFNGRVGEVFSKRAKFCRMERLSLPLCAVVAVALVARLLLLDFASIDYRVFLSRWYDFFVEHGAWRGLSLSVPDCVYSPLYLYFVSVSTLLPLPKLYAIKFWSVAADFVAARYACRLVRSRNQPCSAWQMARFLLLPTVVANGALWGQCDSLYTACLLASLYRFAGHRPAAGLAAFGLAWAFKPQAVFWCPLVAGLLLAGRLPWRLLWMPPVVYLGCALPALFAGRSLRSVLWPVGQASLAPGLTFSAPNWYQWMDAVPGEDSRSVFLLGIILAGLSAAGPAIGVAGGCLADLNGIALVHCHAVLPAGNARPIFLCGGCALPGLRDAGGDGLARGRADAVRLARFILTIPDRHGTYPSELAGSAAGTSLRGGADHSVYGW